MSELTQWWTREQLAIAREAHPEAGEFREDVSAAVPGGPPTKNGGAYGANLNEDERRALASIDWRRV